MKSEKEAKTMENRILELLKDKIRFNFKLMRIAEKRDDYDMANDYGTQIDTLLDVYEEIKNYNFALRISFNYKTDKHELKKIKW